MYGSKQFYPQHRIIEVLDFILYLIGLTWQENIQKQQFASLQCNNPVNNCFNSV